MSAGNKGGTQKVNDVLKQLLVLQALTVEEAKERRERLAKMRSLLFAHEQKAKRLKAIKSKGFHRHAKKAAKMKVSCWGTLCIPFAAATPCTPIPEQHSHLYLLVHSLATAMQTSEACKTGDKSISTYGAARHLHKWVVYIHKEADHRTWRT